MLSIQFSVLLFGFSVFLILVDFDGVSLLVLSALRAHFFKPPTKSGRLNSFQFLVCHLLKTEN